MDLADFIRQLAFTERTFERGDQLAAASPRLRCLSVALSGARGLAGIQTGVPHSTPIGLLRGWQPATTNAKGGLQMEKWADQCITHVRYSENPRRIEAVQARPDEGETLGQLVTRSRAAVIAAIEGGTTFVTAPPGSPGYRQRGANVQVIEVDDEKFIRTDADETSGDNLGELPTF